MITCFDFDVSLFKEANLQRQFAKLAHLHTCATCQMMEEEKGEMPLFSCASATAARLGYPLLGCT